MRARAGPRRSVARITTNPPLRPGGARSYITACSRLSTIARGRVNGRKPLENLGKLLTLAGKVPGNLLALVGLLPGLQVLRLPHLPQQERRVALCSGLWCLVRTEQHEQQPARTRKPHQVRASVFADKLQHATDLQTPPRALLGREDDCSRADD